MKHIHIVVQRYHRLSPELFHLYELKLSKHQLPTSPSLQPLATAILSVSMNVTLHVFHTVFVLFCLAYLFSTMSPMFSHVVACVRISFLF